MDCKYQRGPEFNRQHPFVDILLSDITESAETLDTSELVSHSRRNFLQVSAKHWPTTSMNKPSLRAIAAAKRFSNQASQDSWLLVLYAVSG